MCPQGDDLNGWLKSPNQYAKDNPPRFKPGYSRSSEYVEVRDGTKLAVDIHLPTACPADTALPTLVIFTPYYRRFMLQPPEAPGVEASPNTCVYRDFFVPRGYAVVTVDVRGTGASFGTRDGFRSPIERNDYYDLVDWTVKQSWCDGNIGSLGISYLGAAACFLASTGHPAVKAVAPMFAVWDTWTDYFYPGGLLLTSALKEYNELREAMDLDQREKLRTYAYYANAHLNGPAPTDADSDGRLLAQAIEEHKANIDMNDFFRSFEFREAPLSYDPDYTSAQISPYHYAQSIPSDVAYYCISGWMDGGGYSGGVVRRFLSLKNKRKHLLLGPWDHGARAHVSPYKNPANDECNVWAECLRFFDHYLKGIDTGFDREAPVHYYTIAEESWKAAPAWPIPQAEEKAFYLGPDHTLSPHAADAAEAFDEVDANIAFGTGSHTRYERVSAKEVSDYYSDWDGRDAALPVFSTPALEKDTEITGHPVLTLHLSSTERDGAVFAYLEDVDTQGKSHYVTEGVLRILHRKVSTPGPNYQGVGPFHSFARADAELMEPNTPVEVSLALFPTSWVFRKGHRIRLALATADYDHYVLIPAGRRPKIRYYRDGKRPSSILLPVVDHS